MSPSLESPVQVFRRESMAKRVADTIRDGILAGKYQLGQRLRQIEIEEQFGVSSSVVREAFHVLQGEGIVVADPYRGRCVFSLEEEDARALAVVRTSLESAVAFLAAERLDAESRARISTAAETMRISKPATYVEWVGLELRFHRAIWEATHLDWLCQQLGQLALRMLCVNALRYFCPDEDPCETFSVGPDWEESSNPQGHQLLAQSILRGDAIAARQLMILHLMGAPGFIERRQQLFGI